MQLFEENVDLQDRRHMFRVFPDCFIAREAVDMLMNLKIVRSRNEAVHLVRKLNQKVFCCQHVCMEHDFEDEYLFFRLVPKNERMPAPIRPTTRRHRGKSPKRSLSISTCSSVGNELSTMGSSKDKNEERRNRRRSKKLERLEAEKKACSALRDSTTSTNTEATVPLSEEFTLEPEKKERANRRRKEHKKISRCSSAPSLDAGLIKQKNRKRAEDIKNRLANFKQEMKTKQAAATA
eukprot:Sro2663_g334050.2  (236) ;mRNA; r:5901-6608